MTELQRIHRRLFLRDIGRGTVALAVLGPVALAACSSDGDVALVDREAAGADPTAVPVQPTEVPAAATPQAPAVADATTAPDPTRAPDATTAPDSAGAGPLRWEQVSLGFVSAYVLARGDEVAIVDTGQSGSAGAIGDALAVLGAEWGDVDHVILTHLHGDHVGGLPGVLDAAPAATAYAGAADVAGINSARPLTALNGGDQVFGLEVIATPGHTAGHISVYDADASFVVAGDALIEQDGMILGPAERFTDDQDEAHASVRRLAERQFETVVFGHGDPFLSGASDAIVALAQTL